MKALKTFELQRVGSKLFHSMIVEGKNKFLKKLRLKKGMLSTFLVAYTPTFLVANAWVFSIINLKRYWELSLL